MRSELKEALRRIHGENYRKLLPAKPPAAGKKSNGNGSWLRRSGARGPDGIRVSRKVKMLIVFILAGFGLYVVAAGIYYFNRFSLILVELDKCESLVDNELKRRANLLPNLLIISGEYRSHEKRLYEHVSEMRSHLTDLKREAPRDAVLPLSKLMSSLLAIAEEYPELKATQSFEKLMSDWTETENRIADARATYIQSIRELNALCTTFPSNVYARFFDVYKRVPFSFGEPGAAPINSLDFFSPYFIDDATGGRVARDMAGIGRPAGAPGENADSRPKKAK